MDNPTSYVEVVAGEVNDITVGEEIIRNIEVIS
jgi:hypothetical protein